MAGPKLKDAAPKVEQNKHLESAGGILGQPLEKCRHPEELERLAKVLVGHHFNISTPSFLLHPMLKCCCQNILTMNASSKSVSQRVGQNPFGILSNRSTKLVSCGQGGKTSTIVVWVFRKSVSGQEVPRDYFLISWPQEGRRPLVSLECGY